MKYLQPSFMERIKGVEPSFQAWEAGVLPMNHIRMFCIIAYRVFVFKFFPRTIRGLQTL